MENEVTDRRDQYLIYTDILSVFKFAREIDWKDIRRNSVFRVLYLASVLYSFRYPEKSNPFRIYKFSVDATGPYDLTISKGLDFLIKDDYLKRTSGEDVFSLNIQPDDHVFNIERSDERLEWLKLVVFILGIYGENKIYDFIFRDPEYRSNIKSNTLRSLNIDADNVTVKTLKKFQQAFEESMTPEQRTGGLSPKTYLEFYFEYIFSKILKRED